MTRQDVLSALRELISGRRPSSPLAWHVEDGPGDDLRLTVNGARFDIDVRSAESRGASFDDVLDDMNQEERDAFARDLDEAADEAEREGPVSAEDLRHSLDEATQRGHEEWESRHGAVE